MKPDLPLPIGKSVRIDSAGPPTAIRDMPDQFVIYKGPKDYPDKFVMRRWLWSPMEQKYNPGDMVCVEDTVEAVRRSLPPGLFGLPRNPRWVNIVEVWI